MKQQSILLLTRGPLSWPIDRRPPAIGRLPENDVVVGGDEVSGVPAYVVPTPEGAIASGPQPARDLGQRGGDSDTTVAGGDEVRIGQPPTLARAPRQPCSTGSCFSARASGRPIRQGYAASPTGARTCFRLRDLLLELECRSPSTLCCCARCALGSASDGGGNLGALLGKLVADLGFYGPVLAIYEWRLARRRVTLVDDRIRRTTASQIQPRD